jgi:hypothetical protein
LSLSASSVSSAPSPFAHSDTSCSAARKEQHTSSRHVQVGVDVNNKANKANAHAVSLMHKQC